MAYQQAHTGIRKLFVGRRWSTGYIGATSCTVKRATRADLRLTPLSLQPHPLSLASTFSPSPPLSLSLSLFSPFSSSVLLVSRSPSLVRPSNPPPACSLARTLAYSALLHSAPFCSVLFCSLCSSLLSRPSFGGPAHSLARSLVRPLARSALSSLSADAATPARLTQPNPRANFIPRRLTTTDGRRRPRRRRRRHRTRVTRHAVSTVTVCSCVLRSRFFLARRPSTKTSNCLQQYSGSRSDRVPA